MGMRFIRLLRTSSSERLLIQCDGKDAGAVDIHYLEGGRVAATLILLEDNKLTADQAEKVILEIDEVLLPHACRDDGNVVFTVVSGKVVGSFAGNDQK